MHDICNSYLVPINLKDYNECAWRLCGIYKITNKISGKCYIGQAVDIRKRLQQHVASYIRKSILKIYKAINKYGIDNFQVEVLIILNIFGKNKSEIKKELNAQECFYIQLYDSYKNGYNSTPGGDSGRLGFKHTTETILKIKEAHKNYKPKVAYNVSKCVYCYDIITKTIIDSESISDMSHKTSVDYRSISQICNNIQYKISGRFISKRRYLFSFSKEELLDRIDWFNSQEYINKKKHRKRGRL